MIGNLAPRERMIIIVGGAILLGVLVWQVVVEPIRERYRVNAELVPVREQVLTRRQELLARRSAIHADLDLTNARLEALNARLLPTGTPAVAASELQKMIKEMATQAATEVRSERILPPVERGELLEVPVEIAVSGDIRQLVDLLSRLERAPRLVAVQDLKVRVINISQPRELLVTLTLSGFLPQPKART